MELRVLRYFLAVAREGNISRAADFLHVTQPTLSRQIKDLEEELGCRLFIRNSHSISLTAEGMMLRKRAEEIVELAEKTKADFSAPRNAVAGDVYIGGGETHGMRLIAEIIAELRRDCPDIRFHLYSGNAENVTERLDKGLLDFGLLIQPTDLSKYDSVNLPAQDVWGVIMPKDCPLARKETICKKDLEGLPLICSQQVIRKTGVPNSFQEWFGRDFDNLNVVATYNLVFNAALLAERGIGYVLSLEKLIDGMNGNLCFRPLSPSLKSGLDVVWKKYQAFSPAANVFLDALRSKLQKNRPPRP